MTTEAVVNEETLFDDAFAASAAEAEKGTTAPKKDEPAPPQKTDAEIAAEAAAAKAADDAAALEATKAAEAAALAALTPEEKTAKEAETAAAAKAAADAAEATARVQAAADATAAEAARVAAAKAAEETPTAKAAREALEASLKPYEPTEEEKKALAEFKKEWPEQAAAVEAKLKSADQAVKKQVYDAVQATNKLLEARLAPVEAAAVAAAQQAHYKALHDAHKDFDEVVPKIPDWIKTQPALLQPTLTQAYEAGDTQQVLDLVTMYKASVKPAPAGETAAQIAAREKAAAAAKKAEDDAAALLPVGSKRTNTSPKGAKDPNDFDGAFAEAAEAAAGGK